MGEMRDRSARPGHRRPISELTETVGDLVIQLDRHRRRDRFHYRSRQRLPAGAPATLGRGLFERILVADRPAS